MAIKGIIYRGRIRVVEDAIDVWRAGHDDAMAVRDVEDIVCAAFDAFQMLISWQKESWKSLRAGKIEKVLAHGATLSRAYALADNVIHLVAECMEWAETNGYKVDNAARFHQYAKEIDEFHQEFCAKWPFPKQEEMEANIAAIERGECVDLGDWINELQNANPQIHA